MLVRASTGPDSVTNDEIKSRCQLRGTKVSKQVPPDALTKEESMKKLFISAVALFLSISGIAVAQTATVTVPGEVRTYVLEQKTPSVTFEGDIAVGTALPDTVEIHTIPDQADYSYVIVNNKRVLVNPKTRAVIEVIE
jgi:Protein of unknown function (DUF1236)